MKVCKRIVLSGIFLLLFFVPLMHLHANDQPESESRFARIILFVPDGSEMPPAFEAKLRSIGARTEAFFSNGIEQWGWTVARCNIFSRNQSDEIEVIVVRDTLSSGATGREALPEIMEKAIAAATKKLGDETSKRSVYWVFYHCPDHNVQGFRGMGGRDGGRSINAYPIAGGTVPPGVDLAAKEMWDLNLKGCIHEFGHALGLPHIGPKPSEQLGNTLMGPINKVFSSNMSGAKSDSRVFLSEASAAMLARHPLFSHGQEAIEMRPIKIEVSNISFEEKSGNKIIVKGKVKSEIRVHTVVILDSQRGFGDYWSRSYSAEVSGNGEFLVVVSDTFDSQKGTLTLYFCLEDGRNTATGKREVLQRDLIEFQYKGVTGVREFNRLPSNNRSRRGKG